MKEDQLTEIDFVFTSSNKGESWVLFCLFFFKIVGNINSPVNMTSFLRAVSWKISPADDYSKGYTYAP